MREIYKIVFSPTGKSMKIAGYLAEEFKGLKQLIDLCERADGKTERSTGIGARRKAAERAEGAAAARNGENAPIAEGVHTDGFIYIDEEDFSIFSVPCYGGRVPKTAVERLSRINGSDTPAIVCVTFGNRAFEDSMLELADIAEGRGFKVIGAAAVSCEHNIMHEFGKGRPDEDDKEKIRTFAHAVARKLNSGDRSRPSLPGNRPYKERHEASIDIQVDENTCVCCGMCALKCPVGAISKDGKKVDKNKCISCMRCIEICRSRSIPKEYVDALIDRLGDACQGRKENSFFL